MNDIVAFDADVLIYAATNEHPLGARIRPMLTAPGMQRVGSVLLLPEVLTMPMREAPGSNEVRALTSVLARIDLRPLDESTARLALALAVNYRLGAADAAHLATAVAAGADRFVTNNGKDFATSISEIDVIYPAQLPPPA